MEATVKTFKEYSQGQNFFLPPLFNEFVLQDHEVRSINEVVETLDLSPLLSRCEGGGAPAYYPGDA